MDFTQENFDALQAKSTSLEKAIWQERASKKELSWQIQELNSKFSEIEKTKSSKKEADLVKQGKLEQVLEQKNLSIVEFEKQIADRNKLIEEMTWTVNKFNEAKTVREAKQMEALAKRLEGLEEGPRNTVLDLIKDKPVEQQGELLDQLLSLQGTQDYKVNPGSGDKWAAVVVNDAHAKAQASGDLMWMILNAPVKA